MCFFSLTCLIVKCLFDAPSRLWCLHSAITMYNLVQSNLIKYLCNLVCSQPSLKVRRLPTIVFEQVFTSSLETSWNPAAPLTHTVTANALWSRLCVSLTLTCFPVCSLQWLKSKRVNMQVLLASVCQESQIKARNPVSSLELWKLLHIGRE